MGKRKHEIDKIIFYICSISVVLMISFTYGFLVHRNHLFPYQFIRKVSLAAKAVHEVIFLEDPDCLGVDFSDHEFSQPVIHLFSPNQGSEHLLIVSNEFSYTELNASGCFAWIMDRKGKILHAWKNIPDIQHLLGKGASLNHHKVRIYPVGAHLYPNGNLLVSYLGNNIFPCNRGMVKFDKDSNILWYNNEFLHHWFDIDILGHIYVPGTKIIKSPLNIPDSFKSFHCDGDALTIDTIVILDPHGNIIDEIDLLRALVESGLTGVFNYPGQDARIIHTRDPLHLNDIKIITSPQSDRVKSLNAGDLLLSFRSLNAIGILDKKTKLFKWFCVGATHNQHSPRLLSDGRIFIFDNLGGPVSKGISRIAYTRIPDGKWGTIFPKTGNTLPINSFHSQTAGHIDIHPNEKRMLVSWTHKGLVWEIDIESGEVLWEFINTHPITEDQNGRISVYTSIYVENIEFEMNQGTFGDTQFTTKFKNHSAQLSDP